MSFGIGIGDVLLITKMGFTLWVNISGAKEEREDLMANLMEWKDKLESIKPMLTDHTDMSPHDVKNAKKKFSEALATLQVLEELNRKLVKGRVFRRAAWEVKGRATFLEYQLKLEKKIDAIEKLFACASMMGIKGEVLETKRLLKELTDFPDHRPIRFIDALNRQRLLPWDFCLAWEDFQNMVQTCFKANSAGKSFVERGEYDIINEENGALLRVEDWTVRPGMTLSMAIILRKSIKKGENDYRCPACKTQYTRPVGTAAGYDLERVQCMDKYCKRWFQISSEVTAVATIDAYTITGEQSDLSSTTSYSGEHSKVDDDLTSIQRFHIRVKEISRVIGKDQFGTSLGLDAFSGGSYYTSTSSSSSYYTAASSPGSYYNSAASYHVHTSTTRRPQVTPQAPSGKEFVYTGRPQGGNPRGGPGQNVEGYARVSKGNVTVHNTGAHARGLNSIKLVPESGNDETHTSECRDLSRYSDNMGLCFCPPTSRFEELDD